MVQRRIRRCVRPIILAACVAAAAAVPDPKTVRAKRLGAEAMPSPAGDWQRLLGAEGSAGVTNNNSLEIAVTNSDAYAKSVLTIKPSQSSFRIGEVEHAKITSILANTRQLIGTARDLIAKEGTVPQGRSMMEQANAMFREVKDIIKRRQKEVTDGGGEGDDKREMLRKNSADHDIAEVSDDEKRSMDVTRKIFETMVSFPECIDQTLPGCLAIINGEIGNLGLSTIETVIHEKRNADQEGYNKVVIVTNELADRVQGKGGDGIVQYPFMWNDEKVGQRQLGIDGKWNCQDLTPEDCCETIKQSVPNKDTGGKYLECHIFVPFGGVGNPRRNDRVIIAVSQDNRIHEAPIIQ